jgi:hypothetical protein
MEHDSRIAVVEMKVGTLEKSIGTMAEGIQQLVIAEAKRENDKEIFDRLFDSIKQLREYSYAIDKKITDYISAQSEEDLNQYKALLFKILGLIGLVLASGLSGFLFKTHLL